MLTFLRLAIILAILAGIGLFVTRPQHVDAALTQGLSPDRANGALVFHAGGCASCHVDPAAEPQDPPILAGGYRIQSPFGTFVAPNITPSEAGIGGWTAQDLANALIKGTSPDGRHYYPAFPYTTYTHMTAQDVVDLKAYLDTLPSSDSVAPDHELGFPFTLRRGLALWKLVNLKSDWVMAEAPTGQLDRGRYLVEALGHCGECHTPRDLTGGMNRAAWLTGAPNPSGDGRIPGIAPAELDWSAEDIAYYLESGFTPDYDSAGGEMASVVNNMSQLPAEDRAAIAAYLKALP
ncbi:c-type cytochrome [Marinibacterium sp. SX1]|uniref:c-type cytochrome n=1 Tax=Marinibacterium sp. SX1 TaxID=3388424 RepID=UPI003D16FBF5